MEKLKIASLFSGCGGLDLGFVQAGFASSYAEGLAIGICNSTKTCIAPEGISIMSLIDNVSGIICLMLGFTIYLYKIKGANLE